MAYKRSMFELGTIGAFSRARALRELDGNALGGMLIDSDRLIDQSIDAFAAARPASSFAQGGFGVSYRAASPAAILDASPISGALSLRDGSSLSAGSNLAFDAGLAATAWLGSGNLGASGLGIALGETASDGDVAPVTGIQADASWPDVSETFLSGPPEVIDTPQANETLTVTQTTVLAPGGDTDGDGVIDPGETVLTTVTITNNSTNTAATNVTLAETLAGMTLSGTVNVSPLAINDTYSAVGNTLLEVGNATSQTGPQSSVAGSVFDNDREFLGDTFTLSSFQATSANGGTVNMLADGSFTYVSAAGFTGADTFTYTIRDKGLDGVAGNADDLTSTATVTVNVSNTVWYIDTNAATNGNGTSTNPFNTIANVNAANGTGDADGANSTLYVRGNVTADIVLEAGQSLIGSGSALVVGGNTLAAAGAANTFTHGTGIGVLLNTNNTLSGFNVAGANAAGTGIADNNGTVGTLTVTNVNVTGSGTAIDIDQGGTLAAVFGTVSSTGATAGTANGVHLQNLSGSFSATNGQIETAGGVGFLVQGGNASISYGGNFLNNAAASITVQNRTGGTVTFSGTVTEGAGDGINVTGSAGTINFTGQIFINSGAANAIQLLNNSAAINFTPGGNGLDITTTTGAALTVDGGGGTITLTGSGNTIQTLSGRAVEIDGVTIGAAGVTFQSVGISDGGSTTGIFLNNAGSGGFTITGTGSTAGSGGTISSIDGGADGNVEQGIGIYINNTNNVSLSNMNFTGDFANFGIRGVNVNNFTLRDSTMNGAAGDDGGFGNSNAFDEGAISFSGLTGTALFEGNNLSDGHEDVLVIDNSAGALNLTVRDSANDQAIIGRNGTTTGNDGILVNTSGTASVTALIEGVEFTGSRGDMIQFNASGTATQNITIRNNTLHNTHPDVVSGGGGVSITGGAGTGAGYNVTYRIEGNSMRGAEGTMLFINHLGDAGTVSGSILNNTIGLNNGVFSDVQASTGSNNGGNGIFIGVEHGTGAGNLTHAVLIQGNNIGDIRDGAGIFLRSNGDGVAGAGTTRLEATIRNNTIDEMGLNSLGGIYAQVGGAGANDDGLMGLNIENNIINLTGAANSIATLVFDDLAGNGQFYFPGYAGPYDDNGLRIFHSGPEGNTLTHPNGTPAHVLTAPTGTFATGAGFVLTVPPAAEGLSPKTAADWEAELRALQVAALDEHLASLIADEASLLALAQALAQHGAQPNAGGTGLDPLDPSPQAGQTISVNIPSLPNGRSVTIQWLATIDPQNNGLIVNPVNSGTVTADGPFPGATTSNIVTTVLDTLTLGGTIWNDNGAGGGTRGNGLRDGGEPGIDGLTVAVFADANNDDVADTPGTALATTTTAGGGNYSFAGLAPGNYIVRVSPGALVSSAGSVDPDNNVDNDNNGNPLSGGFVSSNAITLAYNTEPTNGTGNDTNTTLDIALVAPNAPPAIANLQGDSVTYTEDVNTSVRIDLGTNAVVSDPDSGNFNGGSLTVSITSGFVATRDRVGIIADGVVSTTGGNVTVNGVLIGTVTGNSVTGQPTLVLTFTTDDATPARVQEVITRIFYGNGFQDPVAGTRGITVTLVDGDGAANGGNDTATYTTSVNVVAVNDAPVLNAAASPELNAVNEDAGAPVGAVGTLVSALVDSVSPAGGLDNVTDPDGPNFGVAITGTNTANGTWFYSLNNGTTWNAMGIVSDGAARFLLADGQTRVYFQPNAEFSGTIGAALTFRAWDGSTGSNGGLGSTASNGGTTAFSSVSDTASLTVTAVNDAPVLDLNGAAAGLNNSANYVEQAGIITLAFGLTLTDADSATLAGATVQITAGFVPLGADGADYLGISGSGSGTTNGINYSYSALTGILTLSGNASVATYRSVLEQVTFQSNTNNPGPSKTITWTVTDGAATSTPVTTTITVTQVDDPPVTNAPGAQNGTEDTNLVFSTANGNALTVTDVDSPTTYVALLVNNGTLTLSQTTGLTFVGGSNGSSTIVITGTVANINAALNGLIYRGNLNYEGTDTLTFQASRDGQSLDDQDQIAITLADDGVINGDAGNNTLTGTPGNDYFDLRQGGDDNVTGQGGDDGFYFGGAYTSADVVDGGAGTRDQIGLQGDYSGGVTLGSINGVEQIVLLPGSDTRFGDTAGNFYDYNIIAPDSAVAAGQRLIIQANTLRAGEDFTFNGAAETNGDFLIFGGLGVDTLTGGAGNDGFFFGQGRFGASDVVNGGAGTMDQLGLQGNFNLTFGAGQLSGIEFIVLLSAGDNRFGSSGGTVSYNLTTNNANVAAGQTMTVSANTLQSGENLTFNGSGETDGRFEIFSGDGNDVITGGAGNDLIVGGGRGDTLTGGGGNDIFLYRSVTDSNSTERDGIQDFTLGDRIDLSRIDANTNVGGNQDFSFVGTAAFSGTAGELRYENISLGGPIWLIQGDVNGDGVSDLEIVLVIPDANPITVDDFIGVNAAQAALPAKALGGVDGLLITDLSGPDTFDFGVLTGPDAMAELGADNAAGAKAGYLDMAFARDFGGPDIVSLIHDAGDAAFYLGPPDDLAMVTPNHDLTL